MEYENFLKNYDLSKVYFWKNSSGRTLQNQCIE